MSVRGGREREGGDGTIDLLARRAMGHRRQGDDLASRPVAGPFPAGIELRLGPAGYLSVVPDRLWESEDVGVLWLRRRDGMPVGAGDTPLPDRGFMRRVGHADLLGPLPVGTYRFEVRLGALRLPDAVGVVKAGRVEVLRIVGP